MNFRSGGTWGGAAWAVAAVLAVLAAATRLSYSYDEISAAHTIWRVSGGAVPYRDFASNHLPFYWYLLAPFSRLCPQDAGALAWYRALAVAGRGLFVAFLAALAGRGLDRRARPWAALAVWIVACSAPVLDYLVKFSPDAVSNALLFGSLYFLFRPGARSPAGWFLGGLGIAAALLSNNKYVLLPLLLGPAALARELFRDRRPWRPVLLLLGGAGLCLVVAVLALRAWGIEPVHAWDMAFRYNAAYEQVNPFRNGFRMSLLEHPGLLLYVVAGAGVWLADSIRARRLELLPAVVLIFLAASLATVSRPHSQYFSTWFLLGSVFPAQALAGRMPRAPAWGRALTLLLAAAVPVRAAFHYAQPAVAQGRAEQQAVFRFVEAATPENGFVIANMSCHPLCRTNTFYKFSSDLAGREDVYDRVAARIPGFSLAGRFSPERYERDLESRPPQVIFDGIVREGGLEGYPFLTEAQAAALNRYLERHAGEYEFIEIVSTRRTDLPPFRVTQRVVRK